MRGERRRNQQQKKHKTWEGDGILQLVGSMAKLLNKDDHRL